MSTIREIEIRAPDDWHVHLRDGDMLRAVAHHTARDFRRAVVMPNLVPPVRTARDAVAYRARISAALPPTSAFAPLMTAYLTDDTDPEDIESGHRAGALSAVKLYPAGATTNSASGVTDVKKTYRVLEAMAKVGMPLLVHGEVTDPRVDIFDREAAFIERVLAPVVERFPELPVVLEHATTQEAVDFVTHSKGRVAATITAHHLVINRNALFEGGLRPHAYCLPVAKREEHRLALRAAATSGNPRFFLGTDTAPHLVAKKECDHGCAGIFSAPVAMATYAEVFEDEGRLDTLEAFASLNGPRFYGIAPNDARVFLKREPWTAPAVIETNAGPVQVFRGGETLRWQVVAQ